MDEDNDVVDVLCDDCSVVLGVFDFGGVVFELDYDFLVFEFVQFVGEVFDVVEYVLVVVGVEV